MLQFQDKCGDMFLLALFYIGIFNYNYFLV